VIVRASNTICLWSSGEWNTISPFPSPPTSVGFQFMKDMLYPQGLDNPGSSLWSQRWRCKHLWSKVNLIINYCQLSFIIFSYSLLCDLSNSALLIKVDTLFQPYQTRTQNPSTANKTQQSKNEQKKTHKIQTKSTYALTYDIIQVLPKCT